MGDKNESDLEVMEEQREKLEFYYFISKENGTILKEKVVLTPIENLFDVELKNNNELENIETIFHAETKSNKEPENIETAHHLELKSGNGPENLEIVDDNRNDYNILEVDCHSVSSDVKLNAFVKQPDGKSSVKSDITDDCDAEYELKDNRDDCGTPEVDCHPFSSDVKPNAFVKQPDVMSSGKSNHMDNYGAEYELKHDQNRENTVSTYKSYCDSNSNGEVCKISDEIKACLDRIIENIDSNEEKNKLIVDDFILEYKENSEITSQGISVLHESSEIATSRLVKSTKRDSPIISIISGNKDYNTYEMTSTDHIDNSKVEKEEEMNNDSGINEKPLKELYCRLEILKPECAAIKRKLVAATDMIPVGDRHAFITKIKKELISFVQLLEDELKFRNKCLKTKCQIGDDEQVKPSCLVDDKQEFGKIGRTPTDKDGCKLKDGVELENPIHNSRKKTEGHRCRKHHSEVPSPRTTKKGSSENLHKKKLKVSYNHEQNFPTSPEKFMEDNSEMHYCLYGNCACFGKNAIGSRFERGSKTHRYRSKDYYNDVKVFSKSYVNDRELILCKSDLRNRINHISFLNQISDSSNSPEKKIFGYLKRRGSRKQYGKFQTDSDVPDINSDTNESSSNFISSDIETITVPSDSSNKTILIASSDEGEKFSLKRKYFNKNRREHGFEKGVEFPNCNSDDVFHYNSDLSRSCKSDDELHLNKEKSHSKFFNKMSKSPAYIEENRTIEKTHIKEKAYRKNIENKRVHSLVDRQMYLIKKHVSTGDVKMKLLQGPRFSSDCRGRKEGNYFNKEKFKSDINTLEDSISFSESPTKRKKIFRQSTSPSKLARTEDLTSVLGIVKKKHEHENRKTKTQNYVLSPPAPFHISLKNIKSRVNEERANCSSAQTRKSRLPEGEQDGANVIQRSRNINYEERLRKKIRNANDLEPFLSFLKQKEGKYTNEEIIFRRIPVIKTNEINSHEDILAGAVQKRQRKAISFSKRKAGHSCRLEKENSYLTDPENNSSILEVTETKYIIPSEITYVRQSTPEIKTGKQLITDG